RKPMRSMEKMLNICLGEFAGPQVRIDTMNSSWPFSTLGWPDVSAKDFNNFYPTNMLETG
ncbi:hypothetical protein AALP_AAs48402U000100, partial [Arabis alpina]